ncbi:hypothetical protein BKA56DRAFT_622293 [Ilyonectria sp. MPI-CAGE-AT-0026]|nr:hypothetical protein BKA56DRAFT_622293 [Ilyonectria sp. MPI-CAGE-AT-0026]
MLLAAYFCGFLLVPTVRADGWDDFSNNLTTDLAPLLSLFGEQITKQYLSESVTPLDYFIFAMAPMGILTAVVSAIRVCGSPSLRAFVGRAQEGRGNAEAELCSSTSRDVCELYNKGGIARIFGRPKILQIVYDPADPEFSQTGGISTFQEYLRSEKGKKEWIEKEKRERDPEKNNASASNLTPMLALKRMTHSLPISLQVGVLALAVVATYVLQWDKDGTKPEPYACPMVIVGTMMVCGGNFLCAFLVGQSTNETSFQRQKTCETTPSSIYWVQPGQTLGDQIFDPFCYSDHSKPLDEYITSWKNPSEAWTSKSVKLVWVAVVTTVSGFVLQFVGLRGIHSAVSLAQLGAMTVMSMARAALRTQRLSTDANFLRHCPDEVVGHELDWLALRLGEQHLSQEPDPSRRLLWNFCGPVRAENQCPSTSNNLDAATKLLLYRTRLAELTQLSTHNTTTAGSAASFEINKVEVRKSALQLAIAMESAVNAIYSKSSKMREGYENAKSIYFNFTCEIPAEDPKQGEDNMHTLSLKLVREGRGNSWALQNKLELEGLLGLWVWSLKTDPAVKIRNQDSGLWRSQANEIPARRIVTTSQDVAEIYLKIWFGGTAPRLIEGNLLPDSGGCCRASTIWQRDQELDGHQKLGDKYQTLPDNLLFNLEHPVSAGSYSPRIFWQSHRDRDGCQDLGDKKKTPQDTIPDNLEHPIRLIGWPATDLSQIQGSDTLKFWTAPIKGSLVSICAQEVFGSFLKGILGLVDDIGGITFQHKRQRFNPEHSLTTDLTDLFIENQLGSREDASLCILPVLLPHLMPLSFDALLLQAAYEGEMAMVELLLKAGAKIESKEPTHGRTALWWAAEQGHTAIVQLLISEGANFDIEDKYNETPLRLAVVNGHEAVVGLLLDHGADVTVVDKWGGTPLQLARDKNHYSIVRLLEEAEEGLQSSFEDPVQKLKEIGGVALVVAKAPNSKAIGIWTAGNIEVNALRLMGGGCSVHGWPSGYTLDTEEAIQFSKDHSVKCLIEKFKMDETPMAVDHGMAN